MSYKQNGVQSLSEELGKYGWACTTFVTHKGNFFEDAVLAVYPKHWPRPASRYGHGVEAKFDISYSVGRNIHSERNKLGRAAIEAKQFAINTKPPDFTYDEYVLFLKQDRARRARRERQNNA